jgi:hypothetical protein
MPANYLHRHRQFADLIRIVADQQGIAPALVEKDYWIMHCLYGLQRLGFRFELKGGTSLSKGYGIIDRFSEDIDIRIEPDKARAVSTNPNQTKPAHIDSRRTFYDWLAQTIHIDGIEYVARDQIFDDTRYYRSGGIRLAYSSIGGTVDGLKDGILLEIGFDTVTPNQPKTITSWAYDFAVGRVDIVDNRARDVACYHPGYTLVEKLQAISTKFRNLKDTGEFPPNFMRHYYDVYKLLKTRIVQDFIGTEEYLAHKAKRFPKADNPNIAQNEAFRLSDDDSRQTLSTAYARAEALYYRGQPPFDELRAEIARWAPKL